MTQIWAKTDIKALFFLLKGQKKALAEGRSPPQDLEEGPRSGPHLLVLIILFFFSFQVLAIDIN